MLIRTVIKIILFCFLLSGCVTVSSVKRDMNVVDRDDGVNQKEAVAIARMAMINSKLNDDYNLWACTTHDFTGYWKVVFYSLRLDRDRCILVIEKRIGEILAFFTVVNNEEAAFGTNPLYSVEDWKRVRKFD